MVSSLAMSCKVFPAKPGRATSNVNVSAIGSGSDIPVDSMIK